MKKQLGFLAMLLLLSSCDAFDVIIPAIIQTKITAFNTSSVCSDAKVDEYFFQGKTVYVFDPGTCGADMTSEVMDADATTLGYLGGFAGNTKINGEEFSPAAVFIKNVWKK
jgi:hypothetical protein